MFDPFDLCGVGGIKLFVKKNTFVFFSVCVSQISFNLHKAPVCRTL